MIDILSQENVDQYTVININSIKESLEEFRIYLRKRKSLGFELDLEEQDIDLRLNFEPANSIICIFFPYLTENHNFNSNISVYAQGLDYHIWAKEKLKKIAKKLKEKYNEAYFSIQVDNGALNERFLALESGLGYKGLNNMVINEVYGSYGFLGLIITDLMLEEKKFPKKTCMNCRRCIENCPAKALSEDGFSGHRCVSYLTQKKGNLNEKELEILKRGNKVYGCDVCQMVCPHNEGIKRVHTKDDVIKQLNLDDIIEISNKEFKKIFGNKSFAWRGKNILIRNFIIIGD